MKELTHHLCKRLVAEHYAALKAHNGSDSGGQGMQGMGSAHLAVCGAWQLFVRSCECVDLGGPSIATA